MNNLSSKLLSDLIVCLYFPIVWCLQSTLALRTQRYYGQELPHTQSPLCWKNNGRAGEERNLVYFFFPWSHALCARHQSLAFRARQAKRLRRSWDRSLIPGRSYKEMYGNISRAITDTSRGPNAAFVIVLLSLQRTPWTYFLKMTYSAVCAGTYFHYWIFAQIIAWFLL